MSLLMTWGTKRSTKKGGPSPREGRDWGKDLEKGKAYSAVY